jgi:hypothetical protein
MALQAEVQAPAGPTSDAKSGIAHTKATTVRLIDHTQVARYEAEWWKLSENAIVPNPFYEPWNILPALEHLRAGADVRFLLVFGPTSKDGTEPLWGLFPLELESECLHLPVRAWAFWKHRYCFLSTPLVDAGHIWEVLDSFWRWFETNPQGCCILDTNYLLADGPFHYIWTDFAIGRTQFALLDYPRAFLKPDETLDLYLARSISKKGRDVLARKKRKLSELGKVEYRETETVSDLEQAVEDFLKLEASGWKGEEGSALARSSDSSAYLQRFAREGFGRSRVSFVSLALDGKPIAMRVNLLSGPGSFTFKIAYDESYSKYSPGMLLEVEYTRQVFKDTRTEWVDSCTTPRHPLHEKVWSDRRMIRRTLFSNGSRKGDFCISAIPFLRFWKNWFRPSVLPTYLHVSTKRQAAQGLAQHGG